MSESESTELVSDSTTRREGVALGTVARGGVGAGFVVGVTKRHGSWRPAQSPLELVPARSWPAQLERWWYEWSCGIKAVNGAMMAPPRALLSVSGAMEAAAMKAAHAVCAAMARKVRRPRQPCTCSLHRRAHVTRKRCHG